MGRFLKICNQLRNGHPTIHYTTIFEEISIQIYLGGGQKGDGSGVKK